MLDSIFSGLSGLIGFSKGLTNISNNVANMNSPGYKARQLIFKDLFYNIDAGVSQGSATPFASGSGVGAGGESISFTQGDFRTTGNDLDVAINGNGFFIFRRAGEELYSRAGQFEFDEDGFVVMRGTTERVLFLEGGSLVELNVGDKRTNSSKKTTKVIFEGTLDINPPPTTPPIPAPHSTNITIIDSLGATHTLTATFSRATQQDPWTVKITEGTTEITSALRMKWDGGGSPATGFKTLQFDYDPVGDATKMKIVMDMTDTKGLSTSDSDLEMKSQDGIPNGALVRVNFDEKGKMIFNYSNGEKVEGGQLALASFHNISALEPVGDSAFANRSEQDRVLGAGGESMFGTLQGGGVEGSNVDLASQFSELIITQRGYQASSQIITAANEMIQQLLEMRGRG